MARVLLCRGASCSLWWVADASGRYRAKEYFDALKPPEKAKLDALLRRMAAEGQIRNKELFRKESAYIYCFKRHQHRMTCFQEAGDWMLVHGFRKKQDKDKRLKREIDTAEDIRSGYLNRTQRNAP